MILFTSEAIDFSVEQEVEISAWIEAAIETEGYDCGELNFIFCSDEFLHKMNVEHLNHDTLTDVITFDYVAGDLISGDIYISVDRVKENAAEFDVSFIDELNRVMIHGVMHLCRYKDKTESEQQEMRSKEDYYLTLRPRLK